MSEPEKNGVLRVVVIVLAVIGALALIGFVGMGMMHGSMMGGGMMR